MPGLAILFARIATALGGLRLISWFHNILAIGFRFLAIESVVSFFSAFFNTIWAGGLLLWADNNPKLAERGVNFIANEITKQTPIAGQLAATTIEQITGITIDKAKLFAAATGPDRQAYKQVMGDEFTQVVSQMLDVKLAQQDFQTRTAFVGSFSNLSSYFGTNLDFQLRSLTIGTISSMFGWASLRHLEGLHQSINWAFGFGWLSWSVLSNAMDATVNAGVKRYYNALIKPHDLSQSQANKLHIRRILPIDTWKQIHANAGMRDDARDWQLALEFNQPSVTEIKTGYQHRELTAAQVDAMLIDKELTPEGAGLVRTSIIEGRKWGLETDVAKERLRHVQRGWESQDVARQWLTSMGWSQAEVGLSLQAHASERLFHLRDAVTAEHLKFLRHGWEPESEARQWLASQNWTDEEIALAFEANRLETKAATIPKAKHLSIGEVAAFVSNGTWDPIRGQQYLVVQGYSLADANSVLAYAILQHAVAITPKKVRDSCEQEGHLANLLTAALSAITVLDPLGVAANRDFMALVRCYITALLPVGGGGGGGTPPPPPPPPVDLSTPPVLGGTIGNADYDYGCLVVKAVKHGQAIPSVALTWLASPNGQLAFQQSVLNPVCI